MGERVNRTRESPGGDRCAQARAEANNRLVESRIPRSTARQHERGRRQPGAHRLVPTPMNERRVTLSDIATHAKVHVTTVSLALRNHPRLPTETRERIQALAKKMG